MTYICLYVIFAPVRRTTIYLSDEIRACLFDLAARMSREKGKRIGMSDLIREAIKEHLAKKGLKVERKEEVIKRMLSTRGKLDSSFEERVNEVKRGLSWEIPSA